MSKKSLILSIISFACLFFAAFVYAGPLSGIGSVAAQVTGNLGNVAKLVTAGAYVGGMAFAVGAIVKFKAHKDAPQQVAIGVPIAYLFVAAALIFIPSVFSTTGATLFGSSGSVAGPSGVSEFGAKKATANT